MTVRVVEVAAGKDIADHLAAGRSLDELVPVDPAELPATQTALPPPADGLRRSYSGPEVAAMTFADPDPVLLYADPGCLLDLVAKPKAGKTTFLLLGCRALQSGEPFLDLKTKRVPVLYLTEQTRASFKTKLDAIGRLARCDDFRVLFIVDFIGSSWDEICEAIRAEVRKWGVGLIVVDTLSDWAHLADENDSAEALRVTRPLRAIAEESDAAVITVRHAGLRGSPTSDVVSAGRGSTAYAGAVDTLCVLSRTAGQGHGNRRELRFVSRKDNVPESMVIELRAGQYDALGDAQNVEYRQARAFLFENLPTSEGDAITEKNILAAADDQFSRRSLQRVLHGSRGAGGMLREGLVTARKGTGCAGVKAFGYWLCQDGDDGF